MGKYTVTLTNAGGTRSEPYGEYDNARDALRSAARIGRKTMIETFGADEYRRGEIWEASVYVDIDEDGRKYAAVAGERPCIYVKEIPTLTRRELERHRVK